MRTRTETLPLATFKGGRWELGQPYKTENYIICTVIGEMCDGTKIWQGKDGKQYTRQLFFGKYYFCEL